MEYKQKLDAIRNFTNLNIKSRKNFTRREKWLISRYYNILRGQGFIEYDPDKNNFVQKVKFVKNKKSNVKGAPRTKGQFIQGAKPSDKIRNGKILKGSYSKQFIELDFTDAISNDEIFPEAIQETVYFALEDYQDEIKSNDYFTIVTNSGWEIGQNQKSSTPKNERKDGRAYTKGLGFDRKVEELSFQIEELLNRSINKYKAGKDLIKGVYLWKFFNQKEPTKKQKRIIKRKKKK